MQQLNTGAKVSIPYHTVPSGLSWPSFATTSAEANSVFAHCACPAGMEGRVGSVYPGVVVRCYHHFFTSGGACV